MSERERERASFAQESLGSESAILISSTGRRENGDENGGLASYFFGDS